MIKFKLLLCNCKSYNIVLFCYSIMAACMQNCRSHLELRRVVVHVHDGDDCRAVTVLRGIRTLWKRNLINLI